MKPADIYLPFIPRRRARRAARGHSASSRSAAERRGVVMAGALICLFLAAALFVALLAIAADRHRRLETSQHELQAQWLVEAGLERAAAKLAREDGFRREDWIVPAEQLDGRQAGRVTITVQPIADAVGRYAIQATARFPRDDLHRTQVTKSIEFDKTRAER